MGICDVGNVKTAVRAGNSCAGNNKPRVNACVVPPLLELLNKYPTEELAQEAVRGLRMRVNEERNRQPHQAIYVADLIEHYLIKELAADWHSHATRMVYREFLTRWIKPHWGLVNIRDVRTVAVESWLRQLRRQDGEDLANSTKGKIRSVMRCALEPRYSL